jgi:cell wall-associated NlpC family hydrolase
VATPRRPALLRTALIALLTFTLLPITSAGAEPGATPADARRELAALNERVDDAVEAYSEMRIALASAQRREAAATARVRRAEAQLRAMGAGLGELARAAYVGGGSEDIVSMMTSSDPQSFLDNATTIDRVARGRKDQMRAQRALRRKLTAEQRAAKAMVDTRKALERRLAADQASIERQVARQEALVLRLESAAARARRLQAEAARADAARRRARASRERVAAPSYSGPASGRASVAVAEAYRKLGKPYRWGAAGPNSFDCSGFTMWVWGKAGVSLPHSSRAQYGYGVHVSKSELRPGDLVFFGSPIHHVGIYVGNGQYIAAPHTGDVVGFRSINRGGWAGATRL